MALASRKIQKNSANVVGNLLTPDHPVLIIPLIIAPGAGWHTKSKSATSDEINPGPGCFTED